MEAFDTKPEGQITTGQINAAETGVPRYGTRNLFNIFNIADCADWQLALLCAVSLLVCVLIARPFGNSAFDDDWTYADAALRFAQTGTLQYDGWAAPLSLFQTIWAAPWIRAFGFSFDLLRYISLPFSAGFVYLSYLTARSAGLRRELAVLTGLTVATSPLTVPLAATFMTEPYACFFGSLAVYAALRCALSARLRASIVWLCWLTAAGVIGGANRQVVWVIPAAMIPWLVWFKRGGSQERRFLFAAVICYTSCGALIAMVLHFFGQPYAPTAITRQQLLALLEHNWGKAVISPLEFLLIGVSVTLPAFLCFFPAWRKLSLRTLALLLAGAVGLGAILYEIDHAGIFPIFGNIISRVGVLEGEGPGKRPLIMTKGFRAVMTVVIEFCLVTFVWVASRRPHLGRVFRENPAYSVFALFLVPYFVLLLPAALETFAYDRYVVPIAPVFAIIVLLEFQCFNRAVPKAAWASLVVLAVYTIVTTHDFGATLRAQAAAADAMIQLGIPRDRISGGFEYDGWTQVQKAHHIQGPNYKDAFKPMHKDCWYWFWTHTPDLTPVYVEIPGLASEPARPGLARADFISWLPPFRRSVIVWKRAELDYETCDVRPPEAAERGR
jgi:Dolichyl-phosphate-mannose-protein mannosyltransferase